MPDPALDPTSASDAQPVVHPPLPARVEPLSITALVAPPPAHGAGCECRACMGDKGARARRKQVLARRKQRVSTKPIRDLKLRATCAQIVALKIQGKTYAEIGEILNLHKTTVKTYMHRASAKGYLNAADQTPDDRMEYNVKPLVMENLEMLLMYRDPHSGLPMSNVTIKAAEGTGLFKDPKAASPDVQVPNFTLRVQVANTINAPMVVREGTVGGTPAYVEAEIVHGDAEE